MPIVKKHHAISNFRRLASRAAICSFAILGVGLPAAARAQQVQDGKKIFSSAGCQGCHGQDGNGGMGAKLRGNQALSDDRKVITQILHGGGKMPAFAAQLDNGQVAAVASYVRQSFGNNFGAIKPAQVADLRKGEGKSQKTGGSDNKGANATEASGESGDQVKNKDTMKVGAAATDVKQPSTKGPDQATLEKADDANDSWLMYNKGYTGQRWSSLDQINAKNADELQPQCIAQLGEQASFQSSPVVYDGLIYLTTAHGTYAVDAKNCSVKWSYSYSPQGPEPFDTNRGVAVAGGRVLRGTSDGHVIALDAKTGELLWNIRPVDSSKGYFLSSAPIVWHDMLFMGTAGADWGAPAFMYAFDVKDGRQIWRFDEVVDETFGGADPASTGGGSNWTSYSLDRETGLLYIPVGNPAPDFAARYRPGKNLYTNSTLVLDAKSGKLDHYYQQIPNDPLDRDTASPPVIFHLKGADGKGTLYVAQANKAGHLYLYNDDTKKEVFKVETTTLKNADAPPTTEGTHVCPGINGGNEWYGPAFDQKQYSLIVPAVDWCTTFTLGEVRYTPGQFFFGGSYSLDPVDQAQGWIRSFSAKDGRTNWKYESELPVVAGVTPTAGGVIFAGELTGDFIVLDAKNGKKLYSFNTGGPIGGGISTYQIDGQQYIAVPSGNMSRTWSPSATPSATVVLFGLGHKEARK